VRGVGPFERPPTHRSLMTVLPRLPRFTKPAHHFVCLSGKEHPTGTAPVPSGSKPHMRLLHQGC